MDEGPFRVPRSADGSANGRPGASEVPIEPSKSAKEGSKSVHRSSHHIAQEKKSKKPLFITVAIIVAVAVIGFGIWSLVGAMGKGSSGIDSGKYQAVFFTNGQVYFGKLSTFNDDSMKLTDVYYLQSQQTEEGTKDLQKTATDQNSPTLIKLGDEIHGPEDAMIISKDQVLFYENLKSDGKVSQSIEKFKNPN